MCSIYCALICVLSYVLSYACTHMCAFICVLSYVCSSYALISCSHICALIYVLSSACSHKCVTIVLSYMCSPDAVSLSHFHPQHCLGSLAWIINQIHIMKWESPINQQNGQSWNPRCESGSL